MNLTDLLDEFNVVIDTAEGLNELRSLILGLAVRGKLVPQDSNDEQASELLKKIEVEKERLYEKGEIRKPKELQPIKSDEKPFKLPNIWMWTRFGEIAFDYNTGLQRSRKEQDLDFEYPYLKMNNITNSGEMDLQDIVFVNANEDEVEANSLNEGDFLFNTRNSVELVGKTCVIRGLKTPHLYNNNILRVDFYEYMIPEFVNFWFNSPLCKPLLDKITSATTNVAAIYQKDLLKLLNPIPPFAEQHRIVHRIESLFVEVDELEEKLNRQSKLDEKLQLAVNAEVQQAPDAEASKSAWNFITSNFDTLYHTPEAIDNLKKNILNEAVRGRLVPQNPNDEPASKLLKKIEAKKQRLYEEGEIRKPKKLPPVREDDIPFEIPESWEWRTIEQLFTLKSGNNYKYEKSDSGTPFVKVGDMNLYENKLFINTSSIFFETSSIDPNQLIPENSVIFPKRGGAIATNKKRIVKDVPILIDSNTMAILTHNFANLFYFYYWFKLIDLAGFGKHTAVPQVNNKDINPILFPLPPLEEQHRIVRRIEELFAICDRFKAQLEQRQTVNEQLVKGLVGEVLEGS